MFSRNEAIKNLSDPCISGRGNQHPDSLCNLSDEDETCSYTLPRTCTRTMRVPSKCACKARYTVTKGNAHACTRLADSWYMVFGSRCSQRYIYIYPSCRSCFCKYKLLIMRYMPFFCSFTSLGAWRVIGKRPDSVDLPGHYLLHKSGAYSRI